MSTSGRTSLDVRGKQARARTLMSAICLVGAAAVSALLLVGHDGTPGGRAMAVLGGALVVGGVIASALVAVNASLARDPERTDAKQAADLLCVATAVVAVLTVVLVFALGSPVGIGAAALAASGLYFFAMLLGIGLWTRAAARRRGGAPQP